MIFQAQIMSNKAADEMMKGLTHSKEHIAPVQFFGTLEIAWMRDCDTVTWEKGMGSGYYQKGKSKRHFVTALEQVHPCPWKDRCQLLPRTLPFPLSPSPKLFVLPLP